MVTRNVYKGDTLVQVDSTTNQRFSLEHENDAANEALRSPRGYPKGWWKQPQPPASIKRMPLEDIRL